MTTSVGLRGRPHAPARSGRGRFAPLASLGLMLAGCLGTARRVDPSLDASCRALTGAAGRVDGTLRWYRPNSSADRRKLEPWCAAVGPPVVVTEPRAAAKEAVDSITVVSWNTHVGGGDLVRFVGDLRAGHLTDGQPVRHFVLLLQEVHRGAADLPAEVARGAVPPRLATRPPSGERRDIVEVARHLGLALYYVPSMRNGVAAGGAREEDRGNAVLSTLPLTDLRAVELPFEAQRRVAVTAVIGSETRDGRRWSLAVTSAHLDNRSRGSRLWASAGTGRRRQAKGLLDGLPAGVPMVVAGDMNTWSLGALEGAVPLLRTRFRETPVGPDAPTFATGWGFRRRLDHMFFSLPEGWSAGYERVADRYGSDHHPLLARVSVGAEIHGREPTGHGSRSPDARLPGTADRSRAVRIRSGAGLA